MNTKTDVLLKDVPKVTDPGKFEGQPEYLPDAYQQMLDGVATYSGHHEDGEHSHVALVNYKGQALPVDFLEDDQGNVSEVENAWMLPLERHTYSGTDKSAMKAYLLGHMLAAVPGLFEGDIEFLGMAATAINSKLNHFDLENGILLWLVSDHAGVLKVYSDWYSAALAYNSPDADVVREFRLHCTTEVPPLTDVRQRDWELYTGDVVSGQYFRWYETR